MKILITGARGGIGLEVALQLAERGHNVIATVHRDESIPLVEAAARESGVSLAVEKLDILDDEGRQRVAAYDIDVLINNAATGQSGALLEVPIDRLRKSFETNVIASIALSQQFARRMVERGSGKIIFVGSLAGRLIIPFMGPYAMTKFALEGAVDSLRIELRPLGIKVCLIEPGAYATGFNEKMHATKYEWMETSSLYNDHLGYIRLFEKANLRVQSKRIHRIARLIVKATESRRPRARYIAPWWQGIGVTLLKLLGR
jgi:short-subunit dehydrogenase